MAAASLAVVGLSTLKRPLAIASSSCKHSSPASFPLKSHTGISSNTIAASPALLSNTWSSRFRPRLAPSDSVQPNPDSDSNPVEESENPATQATLPLDTPKGANVFAVVMVGSRQYIVIPGRYIYTQRLKGANVHDKIILNKVLLVATKAKTYVGKPVVQNAVVHAVVEELGLDKKVIVFKYKRKKNYRRTIGHRQPRTRLRITGISGFEDAPTPVAA